MLETTSDGIFIYNLDRQKNEASIIQPVNFYALKGKIVIPDTIENIPIVEIERDCFGNCQEITEVVLSDKIHVIGRNAFRNCSLKKISKNSIFTPLKIYHGAFWGCRNLKTVDLQGDVQLINAFTFRDCTSLTSLVCDFVGEIPPSTFVGCANLNTIVFSHPIFEIHVCENAFLNCAVQKLIFESDAKISEKIPEITSIYCFKNSNLTDLAYDGYKIEFLDPNL